MSLTESRLLVPTDTPHQPDAGLTWRAVFTGTMGVLLVCGLTPFNEYVVANTPMVGSYFPVAVTSFFFVMIVCVNGPLHKYAPKWALSSRELAVAMLMMLVSCCIPTQGMMRSLIPIQVSSFHIGRADPRFWASFLELHLPAWLFPVESVADGRTDPVMTEFYTRSFDGGTPYGAWASSTLAWAVLVSGSLLTLISMAWIVRDQWAKNERLAFPLAQLELALIEAPQPGHGLNALLRSRVFWIALVFVFAFDSLYALHEYTPKYFPDVPKTYDLRKILSQEPWVHLSEAIRRNSVFFTFIGLTFFIQSRTAFSLWFVWFFMQFINLQYRIMGDEITAEARYDQHLGASLVFAGGVFWIGRHHWQRVLRHAFFGLNDDERRRGEGSFRLPFILMLTGIGITTTWLLVVGVQWWMVAIIVFVAVLSHFVTTRVIAETGLPSFRSVTMVSQIAYNIPPTAFTGRDVYFMGATHMTMGSFTASQSSMTFSLHGLRVADASGLTDTPRQRRGIATVIVWALVFGFIVCAVSSLRCYYSYSFTLEETPQLENAHLLDVLPTNQLAKPMASFADKNWPAQRHDPVTHLTIGTVICAVLQLGAWRFSWWPILPVGYVVGTGLYMEWVWFSIMLGWLAKVLILRFGGTRLFHQARPAFVGMIFGETIAGGVWLVVNLMLAYMGYPNIPSKFLPN